METTNGEGTQRRAGRLPARTLRLHQGRNFSVCAKTSRHTESKTYAKSSIGALNSKVLRNGHRRRENERRRCGHNGRKARSQAAIRAAKRNRKSTYKAAKQAQEKARSLPFQKRCPSLLCGSACETLCTYGIKTSIITGKPRSTDHSFHPRSTSKGMNMRIRRFVPQSISINTLSRVAVKRIAHWMNHYPRRKFHYATAFEASPSLASFVLPASFNRQFSIKRKISKKD